MEKRNTFLKSNFLVTEIIGIAIQIIPFVICFLTFTEDKNLLFFKWTNEVTIRPGLLSSLFALIFYGILSIRMNLFRKENWMDGILSSFAMLLNVGVIASLFSVFVSKDFSLMGIDYAGIYILVIGIILTFLSMRTIAGYVFFLFLIIGVIRLISIDIAMGLWGFLYIAMMGISLFLQIPDLKDFSNLLYEFKGATAQIAKRGFEDIEYAGNDFSRKMENVKNKYQNERNIQNISQDSNIEEVESNQND